MKQIRCYLAAGSAACLALLPTSSFGQAAPAPSPSDQVVNMDAFEVTAGKDTGYVASESTTGTRTATKIADLPFVVNVVTSDFLNDFDYFSLTGNLGYTSSLADVDTEGNFFMRGFPATFYEWNGFYRLGLLDRSNIERIEIIKGPNAAIYGQTSPAGILNFITKRPTSTPYQDVQLTIGSFGLRRLEGHDDQSFGPVSNLVSFSGMDTLAPIQYEYQHQRSLGDVLKLQLSKTSSVMVQVDWYKNLNVGGQSGEGEMLYNYNSATKSFYGTPAPINLARFSQNGPNDRQNREMTDFLALYENRISDVWSFRATGYGYDRHNSEDANSLTNEFDPVLNQIVGFGAPTRTILNEDGGAADADLLAHWYALDHSVENSTLLTFDYSQNWRYRLGTQLPSTLSKLIPSAQTPSDPNYNFVPDYPSWTVVTRDDKVRWDTLGFFAREQMTLLNNRLLLFGGLRHDQVTYNLNFGNQYSTTSPFALKTAGQVQHFVNSAYTPATGVNFKLTPNVALYANYSQSFQASAQSAKLGDQPLPNTRGVGEDYGVKCNFLDGRLVFTAGGYYITENGIKVTQTDPTTGLSESVAGGSQNSKGVETDITYRLSDTLSIGTGGGWVNARLINEGTIAGGLPNQEDGRRPPNIPVDNAYIWTRYEAKALLPGLSFNAGLRYDGLSYPDSTNTSTPNEYRLTVPAYYVVDVGVHYNWSQQIGSFKLKQQVGFSVDNALNADYVDANTAPGNPRGFYFHYTLSH